MPQYDLRPSSQRDANTRSLALEHEDNRPFMPVSPPSAGLMRAPYAPEHKGRALYKPTGGHRTKYMSSYDTSSRPLLLGLPEDSTAEEPHQDSAEEIRDQIAYHQAAVQELMLELEAVEVSHSPQLRRHREL